MRKAPCFADTGKGLMLPGEMPARSYREETMAKAKGLMIAAMEPQATEEEEFNDWYDLEHFPERRSAPGFLMAQRWICIQGWPRYLAFYDLDSVDAVHSEAYNAFIGENLSVWSRRVLSRVLGNYRMEGTLIYPDDAMSVPKDEAGYMVLIRFVGAGPNGAVDIIDGLRRQFESRPEVRQLRVFRDDENAGREFLGVLELAAPLASLTVDMGQMGPDSGTVRMMNLYTPYLRRGV